MLAVKKGDNSEIALFPVKISGYQTQCLWDTGATCCLISKHLVAKARLKSQTYDLKRPRFIAGLTNNTVCSELGLRTEVTFSDGKKREVEFVVCDTVPHDLLLGLSFMRQNKLCMEPDEGAGFSLWDRKKEKKVASTAEAMQRKEEACQVEEKCANLRLRNSYERLSPELERAFDSHLKDITVEQALVGLLKTGIYEPVNLDDLFRKAPEMESHRCLVSENVAADEASLPSAAIPWELSAEQKGRLDSLLQEYEDIFAAGASDVGAGNFEPVHIRLIKKEPVAVRNYRTPLQFRDWLKEELNNLKKGGIIETSESPWNSPALVVPKKLDKGQEGQKDGTASKGCRLVVDYRKVNEVLEDANFPIPRIQDLLLDMQGSDVFSVMDIRHAFFTIELHPESRKVTAFSCEFGKFQFRFLPQGLKISPAVFQQKIHQTLENLNHSDAYIDDINTRTKGIDPHLDALREVFQAMRQANFKLKRSKCLFLCKQVPLVGRIVSKDGIHIDPEKINDVQKMVKPTTVGEVRTMLGFTGFLRDHVEHYNDMVSPIQELVSLGKNRSGTNIEKFWNNRCDEALAELKRMLAHNQVLKFPENGKPYELFTDASGKHMSGVLMQEGRPCGYFAKSFKGTQCAWAALTKEAHAVYRSVEFFHVFITGSKVTLRCDHKPLAKFLRGDTRNQMVNRWSINMQQYDIEFEWVATDKNISDCLSRMIESGLYEPHEEPKEDFEQFPKSSQVLVVKEATLRVKSQQLPRAFQEKDMKELQNNNAYCKRVKDQMRSNKETNENFVIKEGLLYRIARDNGRSVALALVIPAKLGLTAVVSVHLELAHPGENAMIQTLKRRVYWKGMSKHIRAYVAGCPQCQLKNLKKDSYPYKHDNPGRKPWRKLAIDIAGSGYGKTPQGNVAVLTAICTHSQYPFAEPLPDKTAASVCTALSKILNMVTSCSHILSDNGPEFTSKEMRTLLSAHSIKHKFTAPYSPQSNGILERWHRFMNTVVRMCDSVREDNDWELSVQAALKAYRCIPHSTSGYSPHYLAFKETPKLDLDKMMPTLTVTPYDEGHAEKMMKHFQLAYGLARKNVCLSRLRNKNVKARSKDGQLRIGDMVTLRDNAATKGQSPWKIGYKVVECESARTVRIEHLETGKKYRVGVQNLKKTEPLAILLENSSIDLFPGNSRLFLPASDMPDLKWTTEGNTPEFDELIMSKLKEAVRDRSHDSEDQLLSQLAQKNTKPELPAMETGNSQLDADVTMEKEAAVENKAGRSRKTRSGRQVKPNRQKDFVYISVGLVGRESSNPKPHDKVYLVGIHQTRHYK